MGNNYLHSDLTSKIIQCFYKVYNTLGFGFLEKVYENAMIIELKELGLICRAQKLVDVYYRGHKVGYYVSDIIVNEKVIVIVKLKATEALCEEHERKLTNYLKATTIEVGILLNFGKKPELRRKIFSDEFKSPGSFGPPAT